MLEVTIFLNVVPVLSLWYAVYFITEVDVMVILIAVAIYFDSNYFGLVFGSELKIYLLPSMYGMCKKEIFMSSYFLL